mgnify:CR=1 FL=1
MKVLYVEWIDAVVEGSWIEPKDMDEVHKCQSIGYLVRETKLSISLAASVSVKEVNGVQTIPKAWIKKKKVVKING